MGEGDPYACSFPSPIKTRMVYTVNILFMRKANKVENHQDQWKVTTATE